uniref:hypothetical protein n=1 Tax=Agathobacter sp. TaxID=2021311 RepID=UPI004055B240
MSENKVSVKVLLYDNAERIAGIISDDRHDEEHALKVYERLESGKEEILSKTDKFTLEDLWYSQYYWFLMLMKERDALTAADYQQELFKILESMERDICIDWEIIEQLEKSSDYF